MKREERRGQLNNDGFSLVELLIAVTILAIIVAPLLHSFVTAIRTNAKARNTMYATAVAEDVMEEFEAYGIDGMRQIYQSAGYTEELDADVNGDGVSESGSYRFIGTDGNTTSGIYDVEVLLDPSPYTSGDASNPSINDMKIADIQNLAGSLNAVYMEDPDEAETAYGFFMSYAGSNSKASVMAATTKTIQVNIDSSKLNLDVGGGNTVVTDVYIVSAAVQYHCDPVLLINNAPSNYPQDSNEYIIFSNEADVRAQAEEIKAKRAAGTLEPSEDRIVSKLANIIIGVQPRYGAGEDFVVVNNSNNVATNLYLVKQQLSAEKENALTESEKQSYRLRYTLIEKQSGWVPSQGASFTSACSLRTNLLGNKKITYEFTNASNGSSIYGKAYRDNDESPFQNSPIEAGDTGTGGIAALTIMQADSLTPLRSYDRMFEITVHIYPEGTLPGAGAAKPLVTMTGTVTNE